MVDSSKVKKKLKALVAIDPTEAELRPNEARFSWFKKWIVERDLSVEAVFISFGHSSAHAITEFGFCDFVKTLNLGKSVDASVLVEKSSSRRSAVDRLVKYSKQDDADVIVVTSHGRSGPGRIVLGSFAESLLAASSVPILFLSEGAEQPEAVHKVLFPTDFSKASKLALDLFLKQMNGFQGEIILFHAIPPPGAIFDSAVLGIPLYLPDSYWLEQKAWTDRECDQMLKNVTSKGFKARMVAQDGVLNTPAAIQKIAELEKVDFIGMASVSRGIQSAVLGSVAKEIFRLRKWPVWVCGPEVIDG